MIPPTLRTSFEVDDLFSELLDVFVEGASARGL
jgi:hypothetical protein